MQTRDFKDTNSECIYDLPNTELLGTELKYLEKVFVEKSSYPKWVIRQIFTGVKFVNDSDLLLPIPK